MADPPSLVGADQFTVADALPRTAVPIVGALGATATPVPVTATLCGLPAALSAMSTDADLAPSVVGVNWTATVHDAPAATDEHPAAGLAVNEPGLAPDTVTPDTTRSRRPVFVTVMFLAVDVVPMPWSAKASE